MNLKISKKTHLTNNNSNSYALDSFKKDKIKISIFQACKEKLRNPLAQRERSLKDTLYATERVKVIPNQLLRKEEYTLTSLDVQ